MPKKPEKEIEFSSAWRCDTCPSDAMTHVEMMEHLKTVHGLESKGLKCNKKMIFHLDCSDSYSSTYEVTVQSDKGAIKMTNSTVSPRKKDDMMWFE